MGCMPVCDFGKSLPLTSVFTACAARSSAGVGQFLNQSQADLSKAHVPEPGPSPGHRGLASRKPFFPPEPPQPRSGKPPGPPAALCSGQSTLDPGFSCSSAYKLRAL